MGASLKTQIVSICAKIVFSQNCRDVKNEVFEKKIACLAFVFFYVAARETEQWKRPNNPTKIVFLRCYPKMRKMKNGSVLAKKCFWSKTVKARTNYKKWFQRKLPQTKNDTFLLKNACLAWVKKWVLLAVLLKTCVLLKTVFL